MSMINVWVHLVWATKFRKPLLLKCIRKNVFRHMRKNAKEHRIHIDFINGHFDHVHVLVALRADQTIAKTVQLIKGESSRWINMHRLTSETFDWQNGYFAVSVDERNLNQVRNYIRNQETHHFEKTFIEECIAFEKRYNLVLNTDSFD
jgi:putative transposase